ncbi:MAG: HAMP domain-containing sensor histidine kinase [Oscillospiraceae bacterium]|nr:HAMP domain-containing sensor histidine kinase [Oscillospiraceae bacterium]
MPDENWEIYVSLYERSVVPTVFAYPDLTVFWSNSAAAALYAPEVRYDALRFLLGDSQIKTVLRRLSLGESFEIECTALFYPSVFLAFTPVCGEDRSQGAIVQFLNGSVTGKTNPPDMTQVISTFSGQFRAPLSKIFSSLFSLSRRLDSQGDPETGESLACISANSYRLLRSTVNITEFGKYIHNINPFRPARQDICRFLSDLCENAAIILRPINTLECHLPPERILLSFDSGKLSYAVLNLISNACRFSPHRSTVSVILERHPDHVLIAVSDSGCGIEKERLPRVFEPYYSYDPSTGAPCGDGLGLTLVRYIAAEHGGTSAIHSEDGTGTVALITLPIAEDSSGEILAEDGSATAIGNRFSNLYIVLSDICGHPF